MSVHSTAHARIRTTRTYVTESGERYTIRRQPSRQNQRNAALREWGLR